VFIEFSDFWEGLRKMRCLMAAYCDHEKHHDIDARLVCNLRQSLGYAGRA